jgi:hypothetical protein
MVKQPPVIGADLRGLNRMTPDAIVCIVDLIEAMHRDIAVIRGVVA